MRRVFFQNGCVCEIFVFEFTLIIIHLTNIDCQVIHKIEEE